MTNSTMTSRSSKLVEPDWLIELRRDHALDWRRSTDRWNSEDRLLDFITDLRSKIVDAQAQIADLNDEIFDLKNHLGRYQ